MFRIVICEDDLSQRELLKGFLYKVFEEIQEDLDLIEFESGEEALLEEVILKGIDIFFLDIQMNKSPFKLYIRYYEEKRKFYDYRE